ncbi:MAG: diguanylate cyclase [Geminicoccaceae bacterium]|nr:diguanylate cyclase [Geminicoccaceae bacterium]MDW8339917.1 diguanylate cyclase [Geminicoccaceae bacterium]
MTDRLRGEAVTDRGVKVRNVLPCRIVASRPELFDGLAELISSFGLPTRVSAPARALAEPAGEPGLDLLVLEGEEDAAALRRLRARSRAIGSPVVALMRGGRPRFASLALALGCEDAIAFPLLEEELCFRLDTLVSFALLARELRLREQVCSHWPAPDRGAPTPVLETVAGDVLLVGAPSPIQVKLADALPLKRVVFARSPRSAAARLAAAAPLLVVHAVDRDVGPEAAGAEELARAARRARVGCVLAAPAGAVSVAQARAFGYDDRIAADDSPEELRLRLGFWLRFVRTRRAMGELLRRARGGPAVDPETGLWSRAMVLDYLHMRESYPAGRARACAVLRLGGLERLAERRGHLAVAAALAALGERLARAVRAEDLPAHLAEGAFCVILPPTRAPDPEPLALRLRELLARPVAVAGEVETLPVAAVCGTLERPADAPRALERCLREVEPDLRRAA